MPYPLPRTNPVDALRLSLSLAEHHGALAIDAIRNDAPNAARDFTREAVRYAYRALFQMEDFVRRIR